MRRNMDFASPALFAMVRSNPPSAEVPEGGFRAASSGKASGEVNAVPSAQEVKERRKGVDNERTIRALRALSRYGGGSSGSDKYQEDGSIRPEMTVRCKMT